MPGINGHIRQSSMSTISTYESSGSHRSSILLLVLWSASHAPEISISKSDHWTVLKPPLRSALSSLSSEVPGSSSRMAGRSLSSQQISVRSWHPDASAARDRHCRSNISTYNVCQEALVLLLLSAPLQDMKRENAS